MAVVGYEPGQAWTRVARAAGLGQRDVDRDRRRLELRAGPGRRASTAQTIRVGAGVDQVARAEPDEVGARQGRDRRRQRSATSTSIDDDGAGRRRGGRVKTAEKWCGADWPTRSALDAAVARPGGWICLIGRADDAAPGRRGRDRHSTGRPGERRPARADGQRVRPAVAVPTRNGQAEARRRSIAIQRPRRSGLDPWRCGVTASGLAAHDARFASALGRASCAGTPR